MHFTNTRFLSLSLSPSHNLSFKNTQSAPYQLPSNDHLQDLDQQKLRGNTHNTYSDTKAYILKTT